MLMQEAHRHMQKKPKRAKDIQKRKKEKQVSSKAFLVRKNRLEGSLHAC